MPTEKCQRKDAVRKSILAIDIVTIVVARLLNGCRMTV